MQPETQTEPFAALEEFGEPGPLVGVLVGSESDREAMEPALGRSALGADDLGQRVWGVISA